MTAEAKVNRFSQAVQRPVATVPQTQVARDRKYTILLSPGARAAIDEDVRRLSEQTGLLVDRSRVTRMLYELLHEDESLFAEVKRRIGADGTTV